jgi:hypothetical protein
MRLINTLLHNLNFFIHEVVKLVNKLINLIFISSHSLPHKIEFKLNHLILIFNNPIRLNYKNRIYEKQNIRNY